MNELKIQQYLKTKYIGRQLVCLDETDSTNNECKRRTDLPDGSVVIAEAQTAGRGRRGNVWASEKGTGAWFSVLLKPNISPDKISQITLAAGLAVCRAIGGKIKYPNDIVIDGKKVCGILTEMVSKDENYVVCGIGVNINAKSFDSELEDKATSLYIERGCEAEREKTVADILNELELVFEVFLNHGLAAILDEYKKNCITLKNKVKVLMNGTELVGICTDINDKGNIIIDGKTEMNSGEISVRGIYGCYI